MRRACAVGAVSGLLSLLWAVWGPAAPASACSCARISHRVAVRSADVVFTGTLERTDDPRRGQVLSSGDDVVHVFALDGVSKGPVEPPVEVRSAASGASCGLELTPGHRYEVVAAVEGGVLRASLCGGTHEVAALPPVHPVVPRLVVPIRPQPPAGHAASWALGAGAAATLLPLSVLAVEALLRRRLAHSGL